MVSDTLEERDTTKMSLGIVELEVLAGKLPYDFHPSSQDQLPVVASDS